MNLRRRFSRSSLAVFLALLGLSGCAYKQLIFNHLDWLIVYQLDSYLDMTSIQEQQIKIPVHETVDWLKAERLPGMIGLLKTMAQAAEAQKISAANIDQWQTEINVWRIEVTDRIATPFGLLLRQLSTDQLEHLDRKLDQGERDLLKLLERSDREFPSAFDDYVGELAKSYEFWFGPIRKDQKQLLVDKLGWNRQKLQEGARQRKRIREYWFEELKKHDAKNLSQMIKRSSEPDGPWNDADYKKYRQETRESWRQFFIAMLASLNDEQWKHFGKVLNELAQDMQRLHDEHMQVEKAKLN